MSHPPEPPSQDLRTISVVPVAHATSHFFHLLLPPLFPAFMREFGLSYGELGLLVSIFFVVSGVGQATAGFLVDRVGARPVLHAALGCFVLAAAAAASAQGYAGLVVAAALAGLGNAPFHPVDFTILNQRVSAARLGHAFSAHGISGNLGWAAAPVVIVGIGELAGQWRAGCVAAALLAAAVLAIVLWQGHALDDRHAARRRARAADATAADAAPTHALAFLRLPIVWLCFTFFLFTSVSLSAVQGFASPALGQLYGLPLVATAFVVTGCMLSGVVGMLLGGFLAARAVRLERTIAGAMLLAAALLLLAGSGWLPGLPAAVLVALAGLGTGAAGPSRDLLVRRAAPAGATGRVYGAVYSGVDIGFAVAAPVFGALLDRAQPAGVFVGAAAALVLGVAAATLVGTRAHLRLATAVR
jgi:MFS family permease